MSRIHALCPVCYRPVEKTPGGMIAGHFDKARHPCPGSYEPYTVTVGIS